MAHRGTVTKGQQLTRPGGRYVGGRGEEETGESGAAEERLRDERKEGDGWAPLLKDGTLSRSDKQLKFDERKWRRAEAAPNEERIQSLSREILGREKNVIRPRRREDDRGEISGERLALLLLPPLVAAAISPRFFSRFRATPLEARRFLSPRFTSH